MTRHILLLMAAACAAILAGCSKSNQPAANADAGAPDGARDGKPQLQMVLNAAGLPDQGNWKCDPILADLDGDERPELIAFARLGNGPRIWKQADAGWEELADAPPFEGKSCGGGLCLADVNGDGRHDLCVADHCNGLYVYLRSETGGWARVVAASIPSDPEKPGPSPGMAHGFECVSSGDLNGDGHTDLVVGSSDLKGLVVLLGDGSGTCWTPQENELPHEGIVTRVRCVDLNGDSHLDLVATCEAGPRVWLGDGAGNWQASSHGLPVPSVKGIYLCLAVGDVNEDGRPDLCFANWVDGPEVYLQNPDSSWYKAPEVFPELTGGAYGVALGDLDQDGHLDLVASGRMKGDEVGFVYGVFLLRGNGHGQWEYLSNTQLPAHGLAFSWGVQIADVNADGVSDVVVASGGIVPVRADAIKPKLDPRLLVWTTQLPGERVASGQRE